MNLLKRILEHVSKKLPKRTIAGSDPNSVYMERFYLCGETKGLKYFNEGSRSPRWWQERLSWLPLIYLHHFMRDDEDAELHNHPWPGTSLILTGGYLEERRAFDDSVTSRVLRPFSINRLYATTFHRVELLEEDCWTIIHIGKTTQSWGFWNRVTKEFMPWREFVMQKSVKAESEREKVTI